MERRYVIADVFTDRAFGGNPLAVYLDGAGLETRQMQAIAREMNLSETTFVTPGSAAGHFRVRIFTPANELPFAGHPTIGTSVVLAQTGPARGLPEIVLELGVGPVRVALRQGGATLYMTGGAERRAAGASAAAIAEALGVRESSLAGEAWEAGYGGVAYLYVPLADVGSVGKAALRAERFAAMKLWSHGVYPFAITAHSDGAAEIHARMFAPGAGVAEDPATGSAAAAFAGSVALTPHDNILRLRIAQGVEMGRPSLLETETVFDAAQVRTVAVGGGVVIVGEGRLTRLP